MTAVKVAHTFEMRPTPPGQAADARPDELMIDWRSLPEGTLASIYLPGISAPATVVLAATMYGSTPFTATDQHTINCPARGVTYFPIPISADSSFAGLLVIEPPHSIRRGQQFSVDVIQLTTIMPVLTTIIPLRDTVTVAAPPPPPAISSPWRRALGKFTILIPVVAKKAILPAEERQLSILRWISQ